MKILESLSHNLKAYRLKEGLTQSEAAEVAGISRIPYAKMENGESWGRPESIDALAEKYGIQPWELFAPPGIQSTPMASVSPQDALKILQDHFDKSDKKA